MNINDIDIEHEYNINKIKEEIQNKFNCTIIWI